jgi:succinylglutamate desuccinylase
MSVSEPATPHLNPEQVQAQSLLNAPVPRLYTNGFVVAQTNADLSLVLLLNGAPSALLSMSFVSAKSLIEELGKAMQFLEESIDQKIPTMNEVAARLSAHQRKTMK